MKEVSCSEYRRLVDDVGDLDRLPAEAFRHVERCAACAVFGRDLVALRALLREPVRVTAPIDFDERLARRIRERSAESPAPPSWFAVYRAPLAAAAAVVVLASGAAALVGLPQFEAPVDPAESTVARTVIDTPATASGQPAAPIEGIGHAPTQPSVEPPVAVEASTASGRLQSAAYHPTPRVRRAQPRNDSEAVLVISDTAGVRAVTIPSVIVGAQEILVTEPAPAGGGTVSDGLVSL